MKHLRYLLLLFSSLLVFWSCNEDTYVDPIQLSTVRGRVLYSVNQQPIRNATVTLSPTSRVVTTDSSGSFRFDSVLVGSYTIRAAKVNYGTESSTITVTADASPLVTILLTDDQTQNRPPTAPTLVSPNSSTVISSNMVTLKWTATDPNRDSLTYDVLLFKSGSATPTASYTGLTVDTLNLSNLLYNTTYLWQVIVKDGINTVNGSIWSFSTGPVPDYSFVFARRINGQYQLFTANATGPMAQLTRDGSNWRPIVSPNRQQIAYISNINTDLQLFVMNADGSNSRQVTTVPIAGLYQTDLSFCWSPDGTQLLYPNNDRLFAIRTDGTGLRVVAQAPSGRIFAGCDWTPQGNRMAARTTGTSVYDNEITTFLADGSGAKSVYVRKDSRVGNPVFSVDGRQLVFSADVSGFMNEQGRQLDARLYLLDLSTNGLTDLSVTPSSSSNTGQTNKPTGTNDIDPRFSPNGSQLLFTNVDNTGNGTRSVYTIELTGTAQPAQNRKLLFTSAEMPYWRQ
ncbi:carboxypeptidase regulatory-like domain-containing protein [Spirosoma radiotolerans]|uniref:WD40 domain protein beta propeller n=1 Tax=Spirosoma radiotolerans TaxID=1379870 RepID=A0A0E3V9N2_9BACT|nr:carboxypeptidase regulatory-like domain-containing protein [Spirosoma radiotolerans]AKD57296.1 WD40 domain protein beta propeller [Spirosoma radiotolerans]